MSTPAIVQTLADTVAKSIRGKVTYTYADNIPAIMSSFRVNGLQPHPQVAESFRRALRTVGVKEKRPKAVARPTYTQFVEYIALNDDESMIADNDPSVCVSMVAHMFEVEATKVIADVRRYLEKSNA